MYYSDFNFLNKVDLNLKIFCFVFLIIFYIVYMGISVFIFNVGKILFIMKSCCNDRNIYVGIQCVFSEFIIFLKCWNGLNILYYKDYVCF